VCVGSFVHIQRKKRHYLAMKWTSTGARSTLAFICSHQIFQITHLSHTGQQFLSYMFASHYSQPSIKRPTLTVAAIFLHPLTSMAVIPSPTQRVDNILKAVIPSRSQVRMHCGTVIVPLLRDKQVDNCRVVTPYRLAAPQDCEQTTAVLKMICNDFFGCKLPIVCL